MDPMNGPYVYSGLEADLYDQLDELSDFDDLEFYRWFVDAFGGRILDVGCGTGRILLPLAQEGREMVGLDVSPEMLTVCQKKLDKESVQARLVEADMRDFSIGNERFDTVMVPGYSLQLLADENDFQSCLASCVRHLKREGQLIVPIYMPWEMLWADEESQDMELRRKSKGPSGKTAVLAYQGWSINKPRQLLHLKNRYEERSSKGVLLKSQETEMTLRWEMPFDMIRRLKELDLSDVSLYGDYTFEVPDEASETIVYVARR